MKRLLLLLFIFTGPWMMGQELVNAYLEPTADPDILTLHTVVWHYHAAGLMDYELIINGNQLEFRMCYGNGAATIQTYDEQEFAIPLPGGFNNYEFQLNFYHIDNEGNCDYSEAFDTIDISFDYPYNPLETIAIPDPNFEGWLEHYGFGDGVASNASVFAHRFVNICRLTITDYDLSVLGLGLIENLEGIQNLYRLKYLLADENNFPVFDATFHPQLIRLNVGAVPLVDLDVSNCPNLEYLVAGPTIGNMDFTQNPKLFYLSLVSPNITSIDLSQNYQLHTVSLKGFNITELDLSNNLSLYSIGILETSLSNISIPSQEGLFSIGISGNSNLTSIDFGNYSGLNSLTIKDNPELISVDLSGCPNVTGMDLRGNAFETIDLSNQPLLETVLLMDNNLQTIDLRNGSSELPYNVIAFGNPEMFCVAVDFPQNAPYGTWIFDNIVIYGDQCEDPIITFPDPNFEYALVNNLTVDTDADGIPDTICDTNGDGFIQWDEALEVSYLMVPSSSIESLEGIEYFSNLVGLDASDNQIAELDISYNELLSDFRLSHNDLESVYFGNNHDQYHTIWLDDNQLLNFPAFLFENLTSLKVNGNQLNQLAVNNGNNSILELFHSQSNPELFCIHVDDEDYANNQPNWIKDEWAEYSENCSLGIGEATLKEQIVLYPNPVNEVLFIETTLEIQSVSLYDISARRIHQYTNTSEISLSELGAGMYFIQLETPEGSLVQQLLKE